MADFWLFFAKNGWFLNPVLWFLKINEMDIVLCAIYDFYWEFQGFLLRIQNGWLLAIFAKMADFWIKSLGSPQRMVYVCFAM